MLDLLFTSSKAITFDSNFTPSFLGYMAAWDALLLFNYQRIDKVFRDGTQIKLGQSLYTWTMGGRPDGAFWMPNDSAPISCYGADEVTGQPGINALNPTWLIPAANRRAGDFLDADNGLFLHNAGTSGLINIYRLADGVQTGQVSLSGAPWWDFLAAAGSGRVLAFAKGGQVALLDYLNQVWLTQDTIRPCVCAAFDTKNNVIISLESNQLIRVFAASFSASTLGVPSALAAPVFVPTVASVKRLHGYEVQTRLTNSDGSGVADSWVVWEITGVPPKGYLEKVVSKTDSDGYAKNFYFAPAAVGDIGEETIQVKAVI